MSADIGRWQSSTRKCPDLIPIDTDSRFKTSSTTNGRRNGQEALSPGSCLSTASSSSATSTSTSPLTTQKSQPSTVKQEQQPSKKLTAQLNLASGQMIWLPRPSSSPSPSCSAKRGLPSSSSAIPRRSIKTERDSEQGEGSEEVSLNHMDSHDSNNNQCERVPEWKCTLLAAGHTQRVGAVGKDDVYQFDEDEEEDSLAGIKKTVIPKPPPVRRTSKVGGFNKKAQGGTKETRRKGNFSSPSEDEHEEKKKRRPAVVVKSECEPLTSSTQINDVYTPPAGVAGASNDALDKDDTAPKRPECRKSTRRRPSVMYIEDPFEIILDSDDLEDFDFENAAELFLNRQREGKKKAKSKAGGNRTTAGQRSKKSQAAPVKETNHIVPSISEPKSSESCKKGNAARDGAEEEEQEDEQEVVEQQEKAEFKDVEEEIVEYRIATPVIPTPITHPPSPPPPPPPSTQSRCEPPVLSNLSSNEPPLVVPQVNPIFLWVRQEDSFIVDVRCEDYDKRNRIRLMKSANGSWRAMPRTEINLASGGRQPHQQHKHKRRTKEKKSRKKRKRHRHHRDEKSRPLEQWKMVPSGSATEKKDDEQEEYRRNMQSCKVSLVPLPELLLSRSVKVETLSRDDEEASESREYRTPTAGVKVERPKPEIAERSPAHLQEKRSHRETHVPKNASFNDNNNNTVKRKHVRFALENTEEQEEQAEEEDDEEDSSAASSGGDFRRAAERRDDASQEKCNAVRIGLPRREAQHHDNDGQYPGNDAAARKREAAGRVTTLTSREDYSEDSFNSVGQFSVDHQKKKKSKKGGNKREDDLDQDNYAKEHQSSSPGQCSRIIRSNLVEEDVGKSRRLQKSAISSSSSGYQVTRRAHVEARVIGDEIEHVDDDSDNAEERINATGELLRVRRLASASPLVVTVLASPSATQRRRVQLPGEGGNNNNQQKQQQQQFINIESALCYPNAEQELEKQQQQEEDQFSEQGTGIFTDGDDVNNNNKKSNRSSGSGSGKSRISGPGAGITLSVGIEEEEDEVTVICDELVRPQNKCNGSYLVIDDDDDDEEEDGVGEGQQKLDNKKRKVASTSGDLLRNGPVIVQDEEDEEEDDDVTFVCSKSAILEANSCSSSGAVIARDEDDNNNNINSAVLGDALGGAAQTTTTTAEQLQLPQPRILTPEEQLHESLKATTELIAGIGGFGFVAADENMSFSGSGGGGATGIGDDNLRLGGGSGQGLGGGGVGGSCLGMDAKGSITAAQLMSSSNLAGMCGGGGTGSDVGNIDLRRDEYNDDDEMLMEAVAPVADIISRLSDSPKCLSFNEMGEIEAISANSAALFDKNHTTTMEDVLAMSIKEMTEQNIKELAAKAVAAATGHANNMTTIGTADSCAGGDDYPRDLTCKLDRSSSLSAGNKAGTTKHSPLPRPISRGSDAIQSPQPSGLPAIPPSPDIFSHNNSHSNRSKSIFLESILTTPSQGKSLQNSSGQPHQQVHHQQQQSLGGSEEGGRTGNNKQKEPLDLGTCRKSASPTVTCSEEVSKRHHDEIVDLVSELESSSASSTSTSESCRKRVKYENIPGPEGERSSTSNKLDQGVKQKHSRDKSGGDLEGGCKIEGGHKSKGESMTGYLMDILNTNANDPSPLTQLRLLISNTEWKVPETLLVPKDRLNAVLASPAREIPLLLTTRPELRLPGAFAFPSILQDPDILVVSLAQLEAILEKQQEIFKLKASDRGGGTSKQSTGGGSHQEMRQKTNSLSMSNKSQQVVQEKHQHGSNKMSGNQKPSTPNLPHNHPGQGVGAAGGGLMGTGLASDIDAATIAAFNQMLWLPYLNQMRGQLTPEVIKAVAGFNEMLPLLAAQSRFQQGLMSAAGQRESSSNNNNPSNNNNSNNNPVGGASNALGNSLEFAMWQEAMLSANNANLRAILKGQAPAGTAAEFAKKQMDQRKAAAAAAAVAQNNFTTPGKMVKQQPPQPESPQMPNPLSPLSIPPFIPPALMQGGGGSSRYFNPMMAAAAAAQQQQQQQNNRSPMVSPTNPMHASPFSSNFNHRQHHGPQQQQQQQHNHRGSNRFNNMFGPSAGAGGVIGAVQGKKGGMAMHPSQFFPFAQNANTMDFDDQMNMLATKKAQKELEQVLQMQQQQQRFHRQEQHANKFSQEQQAKLNKLNMFTSPPSAAATTTVQQQQQQQMNSFLNSAKLSLHHHQQQQQQQLFNQQMMSQLNELSKLSSLMAMPSAFDSPLNPNALLAAQQQQQQLHAHQQNTGHDQGGNNPLLNDHGGVGGGGGGQAQPKLKVKPGLHLLDPMAMQRRLLTNSAESSDEMSGEIVSTTTSQSGLDSSESPDLNSPLWHPLFGNSSGQKMGPGGGGNSGSTYTSPWQWTTVTAAGE